MFLRVGCVQGFLSHPSCSMEISISPEIILCFLESNRRCTWQVFNDLAVDTLKIIRWLLQSVSASWRQWDTASSLWAVLAVLYHPHCSIQAGQSLTPDYFSLSFTYSINKQDKTESSSLKGQLRKHKSKWKIEIMKLNWSSPRSHLPIW